MDTPAAASTNTSVISPPPQPTPATIDPSIFSFQYASFLTRFAASFVDAVIVAVINLAVSSILNLLLRANPSQNKLMGQLIYILIAYAYYTYFIGTSGQTPGKKILHIKVITEKGKTPGYIRAFIRETIGKILSSLVLGFGYFWVIWDGKKQAWHDKIAGTVVIKV